jgi:glycine hydroxymethyltransferase
MTNIIFDLIKKEAKRQEETLMMIPSENYASKNVCQAVGSILENKYAEGYPGRRYYQGMGNVDEIENYCIAQAKKVFSVPLANVQPYSGSPANSAVYFALCEPGDTIMGLSLSSGGHLTHGHPKVTFSGKYFKSIQYELRITNYELGIKNKDKKQEYFDYDEILELARKYKPKVIVCGTTAFPRTLDFKKFAEIADQVGAYLLADVSHIAGLIIAGVHPSPVSYAHVVMSTTHKTLRGPRGAMLLVTEKGLKKDSELGEKINKAVFPGLQGGPHMNTIAGIAIALEETQTAKYKKYGEQIVKNAKKLEEVFRENGVSMVTGGTDNHLILIDLASSGLKPGSGMFVAEAMEAAGIVANKNTIPNEPFSAFYPSGLRLGTPAITTRGMKGKEMETIGGWICQIIDLMKKYEMPKDKEVRKQVIQKFRQETAKNAVLKKISTQVRTLCKKFPVYK